jgi:hypothetical protein
LWLAGGSFGAFQIAVSLTTGTLQGSPGPQTGTIATQNNPWPGGGGGNSTTNIVGNFAGTCGPIRVNGSGVTTVRIICTAAGGGTGQNGGNTYICWYRLQARRRR